MPETPTSPMSVALDALRAAIAKTSFWQTLTGLGETAALARIYIGEVWTEETPDPDAPTYPDDWPYLVLEAGPDPGSSELVAVDTFMPQWSILVTLHGRVNPLYQEVRRDATIERENAAHGLAQTLAGLASVEVNGMRLSPSGVRAMGSWFAPLSAQADPRLRFERYEAAYLVEFGGG